MSYLEQQLSQINPGYLLHIELNLRKHQLKTKYPKHDKQT